MPTQTPKKRKLFASTLRKVFLGVFVGVLGVFILTGVDPGKTSAATADTINFQAKLETAAGAIAADGNYNVEFNLYSTSTGGSSLWTEDYLNSASQGIHVVNGYLTANLGSINPFPSTINWSQNLWIGMTVRGTGSCSFSGCTPTDAEMTPRLKLTAVPYALSAGNLSNYDSTTGYSTTVDFQGASAGNQTITIPSDSHAISSADDVCLEALANCTGTGGGIAGSGTQYYLSVFDTSAGNHISSATGNASLYDDSNFLGLGTTTDSGLLSIQGTSTSQSSIFVQSAASATAPSVVIKQASGQAGNLFQFEDNAGNINGAFSATGSQLSLGKVASSGTVSQGSIVLSDGTTDNLSLTLETGALTGAGGNLTVTLPKPTTGTSAVVCYENDTACGFATTSAGGFIKNQTTVQTGASFNIDGSGTAGVSFLTPLLDTPSGTTVLNIGTTNATGGIDLNQSTTLLGGKNFVFGTGTGNFDQSASTGTFKTGTGAVSLNGSTTVTSGKNLAVAGGATSLTGSSSALTGTGTLSSTGTTVTGSGTSFTTQLAPGDVIIASGQSQEVSSISSNTSLIVTGSFSPVLSGASFTYVLPSLEVINATNQDGLYIQGASSQTTGSLLNVVGSGSVSALRVAAGGNLFATGGLRLSGSVTSSFCNSIATSFCDSTSSASVVGQVIQGTTSQTGNLLQLQDSNGNINAAFSATGNQLTLGRIATSGTVTQGSIVLGDGTTDGFNATIEASGLAQSTTYSLPSLTGGSNSTATICVLYGSNSSNCAGSGGGLTGGGTANQVAYFNGTGTITSSSLLYDNGTSIGINNTSAANPLAINSITNSNSNTTVAQLLVGTNGVNNNGILIQGVSGQAASAYALQVQDYNGNTMAGILASGNIVSNTSGGGVFRTFDTSTASTNTNSITLRSGNASGTTSNSGNVIVDAGTATGTAGTLNLGTANASAVNIGKSTTTTTIAGTAAVSGNETVTASAGVALSVTGAASQDIADFYTSTPSLIAKINSSGSIYTNGRIGTGPAATTGGSLSNTTSGKAQLSVQVGTGNTTDSGLIVKGVASETGDLVELQDSSGNVQTSFSAVGNQLTLGNNSASGTSAGSIRLTDGTTDGFYGTLSLAGAIGSNQTYSLPSTGGTLCIQGSSSCSFAATTGGSGYIQNQNASAQSANFFIQSSSTTSVAASIESAASGTADVLDIYNSSGVVRAGFNNSSRFFVGASTPFGSTEVSVQADNASTLGETIRGKTSQTADLLEIQDANGIVESKIAANGQLTLGTIAASGTVYQGGLTFSDGTTDNFGATIQSGTLAQSTTYSLPSTTGGTNNTATICVLYGGGTTNCAGAGGGVTGTGTANQVAYFNGTGTITSSSLLYDNGTSIGINNTSSTNPLAINGITNSNSADTAAQLLIGTNSTSNNGIVVQEVASQSSTTYSFLAQNSAGSVLAGIDSSGSFISNGTGTFKTFDQSGASLNSNSLTLRSGNATGTTSNSGSVTVDSGTATGTAGAVNIGNTNASAVNIGHSGTTLTINSATSISGTNTLTVGSGATTLGGTLGVTGLTTLSGGLNETGIEAITGNETITASSGVGLTVTGAASQDIVDFKTNGGGATPVYINQSGRLYTSGISSTYSAGTSASTQGLTVTNSNTSATTATLNAIDIALIGTNNSYSNANITNGINFHGVTATTNNTFTGLNFADTSYNSILSVAGTTIINGSGVLQSAALSGTYSNALTLSNTSNVYSGASATLTGAVQGGSFTNTGGTFSVNSTGNVTTALSSTTGTTLVCQNTSNQLAGCTNSYETTTGTDFIQNQTATTQTANFKITGTGTAATYQISTTGSLDTSAAGALNIGLTSGGNATSINLNQNTTVAANKNLVLSNGTGTVTQSYSNTSGSAETKNVTNTGTSGSNTISGINVALAGTANTGADHIIGVSFQNVTNPGGTNDFQGISFGTGYNSLLLYNNASLISGAGILQSAALSGTYSNALTLSNTSNVYSGASATLTGAVQGGSFTNTGGTFSVNSTGNVTTALSSTTGTTLVCQNTSNQLAGCTNSYETTTGTDFIHNQTGVQSSANFNIDGNGTVGTELLTPTIDSPSGTSILNIGGTNTTTIALKHSSSVTGSITVSTSVIASHGISSFTGITAGSSVATTVVTGAATNKGLVIQAAASQTADLQELQNSSGDILAKNTANGQLVLGTIGSVTGTTVAGSIGFGDGTTDGFTGTLQLAGAIAANQTYSLPINGGTLCTSTTCAASGTYIVNGTSLQSGSNFNISGTGIAQTSILTPLLDTPSGTTTLNIGTTNATAGINLNQNTTIATGKNLTLSGVSTFSTGTGAISLNGATTVASNIILTNAGSLATQEGIDYATVGTDNNVNFGAASLYRLTGTSTQIITGIAGGTNGRQLTLINAGSTAATLKNNDSTDSNVANIIITGTGTDDSLPAGASITLVYDSSASVWHVTGSAATSTAPGVNTIGAISGISNANGATISATTLDLTAADGTNGGVVTNTTQTFAGAKSFAALLTGNAGITTSGGAVSLQGNAASSITTTAGNLTLDSAAILSLGTTNATSVSIGRTGITTTVNGPLTATQLLTGSAGETVSGGAISLTGSVASSFTTAAGNLTLQGGSGIVTLGTSTSLTASAALGITSGGANTLSVDAGGAASLNLGTTNANAVSISKTGVTTTVNGALTSTQLLTGSAGITTSGGAFSLTGNSASSLLTANATTSAAITIQTGNSSAGTAASVTVDTGTSSTGTSVINIGTTNAGSVSIGRTGQTTTVNGKLTSTQLLTGSAGITTSGGAVSLTGSAASSLTTTAGLLTLQGAGGVSLTTTNTTTSSGVTVQSGNSSAGTAGTVLIDTGTSSTGTSVINIGTTNAGSVSIGRTGITTTVNGPLTATQLLTGSAGETVSGGAISLTGSVASSFTTAAGNLSLDAAAILNLGTSNATSISIGKTGATTTVNGALTATQLLTGNLGLTVTGGAAQINTSGTANTSIGNTTGVFAIQGIGGGTSDSTIKGTSGSFTTTVDFTAPTANVILNIPAVVAGTYDICTSSGNCNGAGTTLQNSYNNSLGGATPEIKLNNGGTDTAGVDIQDADTSIGAAANLFTVRGSNSGGLGSAYLEVQGSGDVGIGVTGTPNQILSVGGPSGDFTVNNSGNVVTSGTLTINNTSAFNGALTVAGTSDVVQQKIEASSSQTNALEQFTSNGSSSVYSGINSTGDFYEVDQGNGDTATIEIPSANDLTGNVNLYLPTASGTFCTTSGNCAGVGGTGDVIDGGQSTGSLIVGTAVSNMNTAGIDTNGIVRATFDTSGNAYFGTGITATSPTTTFTLQGTGSATAGTTATALTVEGGAGATTGTGSSGGALTLQGGAAGGSSSHAGGNVSIAGGAGASGGAQGTVSIQGSTTINNSGTGTTQIGNGSGGAISLQSSSSINLTAAAASTISTGTNSLTITSSNFNVSAAGVITLAGNQSPADIITAGAATASSVSIQPGTSTANSGVGANLNLTAGNQSGTTSSIAGSVNITGGSTTGVSGTRLGGSVVIDAGTGGSAANNGTVSVGTSNASAVSIGKTGTTTTVNGALTATQLLTGSAGETVSGGAILLTGNAASGLSTTSGDLTIQSGTGGTGNLILDSATSGTVSLGNTNATTVNIASNSAAATAINIGENNVAHTISIGAAGTSTNQAVLIGSTNNGSTTNLQGGAYNLKLTNAGIGINTTDDGTADLQFAYSGTGRSINVQAAAASTAGGNLSLKAGNSGTGAVNGGNLVLEGGATGGSGTTGSVLVEANGTNSSSAFQVQNATGNSVFNVDTTGVGTATATLGKSSTLTGQLTFATSAGANTITVVGPTTNPTGNFTLTIPTLSASATICTTDSVCGPSNSGNGSYLVQIPTAASGAGADVISPTASSIIGLTVNGTTGTTAAVAAVINQTQAADALDVNQTAGTNTNGISFTRSGSGTTTSGLAINQTAGTLTNGLSFSGTIGTDINRASGTLTIQGATGVSVDSGASGTVAIGNTNATTVNIASNSVAHTVNIGSTGPTSSGGTLNLQAGTGGINIVTGTASGTTGAFSVITGTSSAGNAGSISLETGGNNSGSAAINIATYNSAHAISIGTGTTNTTNTINIGTGATSAINTIQIGNAAANTTSTLSLQGGTGSSSAISLTTGATGSVAGGITIGNTTGANTQAINIGTNSTASSTTNITVGSTVAGYTDVQSVSGLYLGNGQTASSPNSFTVQGTGSSTAGTAGGAVTLKGGAGATATTGSAGGALTLAGGTAGTPATTGNANAGGAIALQGGNAAGNGTANANGGNVTISGGTGYGTTGVQGTVSLQGSAVSISGPTTITNTTTSSAINITQTTNSPTGTNALIYAANTNASPTGNLLNLLSGSTPTARFTVDAAGNVIETNSVTQTYSSTTNNSSANSIAATNGASSGTNTVNAVNVALNGTSTSGTNTTNGINFANVTNPGGTNNYNGLSFGTGYSNLLNSANATLSAAGALSLGTTNNTGTVSVSNSTATTTLSLATSASPTTAVIVANDTSAVSTDKLISLQASGTPKFTVDAAGNVVATGTYNTDTLTASSLQFGSAGAVSIGLAQAAASTVGGTLTVQGGTSGTGAVNGGNLVLSGGLSGGTGVQGLVSLAPTDFSSSTTQTYASSTTVSQTLVDTYSTIPIVASAAGVTVTIPSPTNAVVGRVIYIANVGTTNSFTLLTATINVNATATLLWNGTTWTFAGADGSSILNQNTFSQSANYHINGTGTADGGFVGPSLDVATAGTLNLGNAVATTVNIASSSAASTTINIGNNNVAHTISIGTGGTSAVEAVTVGSTDTTSNTIIQGGSTTGDGVSVQSGSTTAFRIQNSGATYTLLTADTTNKVVSIGTGTLYSNSTSGDLYVAGNIEANTGIYIGTSSGNIQNSGSGGALRYSGNSRNTKEIILTPEYAGAVLDTSGANGHVGTMTSGYDSSATPKHAYYDWTTTQTSTNDYDVVVTVPVPSDWSSWSASNSLSILTWADNTTNSTGTITAVGTTGSTDTTDTTINGLSVTPSSASTWTTTNSNFNGTYNANGTVTLRLHVAAKSGSNFRLGNITLTYLSAF